MVIILFRYAITIWYFDQNEKNEALERRKKEMCGANDSCPSPVKTRTPATLSEWQSRPSAFKPVASSFVPPDVPPARGASSVKSELYRAPPAFLHSIRANTHSDSLSTGSTEDNIDESELQTNQANLKPEYQI